MGNSEPTNINFDELRRALLELSRRQNQLRRMLQLHLDQADHSLSSVAKATGLKPGQLQEFLDGSRSFGAGRRLDRLCELMDCGELGQEMTELFDHVADRYRGLLVSSKPIIVLVMTLLKAYQRYGGTVTYEDFAHAFGQHAAIVHGALNSTRTAVAELANDEVRESIERHLSDPEFDNRVADAVNDSRRTKLARGKELDAVVEQLAPRFGGNAPLARALKVDRGTLREAMRGEAGLETIERLIASANRLTRSNPGAQTATTPVEPTARPPTAGPTPAGLDALLQLGGETTENGLPFVLTKASFQPITNIQVLALRDGMRLSIQFLRGYLNIGAQLSDPEVRAILQEDLESELKELSNALKLFGFAEPNRLLDLFDNDRAVRATKTTSGSRPRKGER